MAENDPFYYTGPRSGRKGYVAVSLEILGDGPFKVKVAAVSPSYVGYFHWSRIFKAPIETFYYLTWTGFLSEWKRRSMVRDIFKC